MSNAIQLFEETAFEPTRLFVDLKPFLDGTATPALPTVAEIWSGRFLFYREAVNEIHGEPSAGKTNILLCAAALELEAGGSVVYLDPEDTPSRIVARALALGIAPEAMRERFHYLHDPGPDEIAAAQDWAAINHPALVVLDGLAEALARENLDENKPGDILTFFRERIRPFAEAGAAVVVADHVVKSSEGRGRWARGSGAKLGHYNGASYEVTLGEAYTPTTPGFVKIKVSKDRNGGVGPQGATVAELHFAPGEGGSTISTWQSPPDPGSFRPTAIMDKISALLRRDGEANTTALRRVGKAEYVDMAIELMLEEGAIVRRKQGQAHVFSLAEPQVKS